MDKKRPIGIILWPLVVIIIYGYVLTIFFPSWIWGLRTYPVDTLYAFDYVINVHLYMIISCGFTISGLAILWRKGFGRKLILWTEFLNMFYMFLAPFVVNDLYLQYGFREGIAYRIMQFTWYMFHIALIYYFTRPRIKEYFK